MFSIRNFNSALVTAGSMASSLSGSTTLKSGYGTAVAAVGMNIQAVITGSSGPVVGTLKLQASDDDTTDIAGVTNWTDITGSSFSVSGNGSFMWEYDNPNFQHVKLVYTSSSGSGTLNARIKYKGYI